MKIDEYYIIPIECTPRQLGDTEEKLIPPKWERSTVLDSKALRASTEDMDANVPRVYSRTDSPTVNDDGTVTLYIALVDTCLCFVYHRSSTTSLNASSGALTWTRKLRKDRKKILDAVKGKITLLDAIKGKITLPLVREALTELSIGTSIESAETYGFSVYVLTLEHAEQKVGNSTSMLDDIRSLMGVPTEEEEVLPSPFSSKHQLIENVDVGKDSAIYASYSAVVGLVQLGPSVNEAKAHELVNQSLLRLQVRLQAAWNRCHQASRRIRLQRATEITAMGGWNWLRTPYHYRSRQELASFGYASQLVHGTGTPGLGTRERLIFDEFVRTSRILNEIDVLEKYLEQENYLRLEAGQRWISGVLALVAGTSTAQALLALSHLTIPGEVSLSIVIGSLVVLAVVFTPSLHGRLSRRKPRPGIP